MSHDFIREGAAAAARAERRRERRFPLDVTAELAVLDPAEHEKLPAQTLDVSKSGLRVRIQRQVHSGTYVEVRWPALAIYGEIRYCFESPMGGFDLGIRVEHAIHNAGMNSSEHLSRSILSLFLAGALPSRDMQLAGAHVQACAKCRREMAIVEDPTLAP